VQVAGARCSVEATEADVTTAAAARRIEVRIGKLPGRVSMGQCGGRQSGI
jgi:hypothetical protein